MLISNCPKSADDDMSQDLDENDILFNRKQAAKYLGFMPGTLAAWAWNKRYDLQPIKVGRSVRYRKSILDKFRNGSLTR